MNGTKILYVNRTMNADALTIIVFAKKSDKFNENIIWKVIDDIKPRSCCMVTFRSDMVVYAIHNAACYKTAYTPAIFGRRFCVTEDKNGVTLVEDGNSSSTNSIEIRSNIKSPKDIDVCLNNDGRDLLVQKSVKFDQIAKFSPVDKLYFGIVAEANEGENLCQAVLTSDIFFEVDIKDKEEITIGLYGNKDDGFRFRVENEK